MDKIYYQPNHLLKGQKAVEELRELSGEEAKAVKQWLSFASILASAFTSSKRVDRPYYEVIIPNEMHQFDLF